MAPNRAVASIENERKKATSMKYRPRRASTEKIRNSERIDAPTSETTRPERLRTKMVY